jgi:uncharacterized protein YceK
MTLRAAAWGLCLTSLLMGGCASLPNARDSAAETAAVAAKIPLRVADREGWATDIQRALEAQDLPANVENICATLAVLEQESGYVADPAVAGLGRIARTELERRANAKLIPDLAVDAALRIRATDGRTYGEQLSAARTERELSLIFEDMVGRVPLGARLFDGWNPVQTGGPMQVSIPYAEANARGYPYPVAHSIRREVFSRRGGMYFGIKHLLDYQTPYTRKLHRFADYNAGHYASRNAAFQSAVAVASGRKLALDGDVLTPGAPLDRPGETEQAVRELSTALGMGPQAIREALSGANTLAFSDSALFKAVFLLAEQRSGRPLPRAQVPGIRLESPKITRALTTAWFASRVDGRYRQCLSR